MQAIKIGSHNKIFNSNTIQIKCKQVEIEIDKILPYLNPKKFNSYCKDGCPNHSQKWTCPPNCPSFENYSKEFSMISLFLFYTEPSQFPNIESEERALQAYNFIKEELQKYLREIEPTNGKMIAANSCEICKTCGIVSGNKCHIPEKMRYNLVAFGFNVGKIMSELFQHELQWAEKNQLPEFVSSVGAILK